MECERIFLNRMFQYMNLIQIFLDFFLRFDFMSAMASPMPSGRPQPVTIATLSVSVPISHISSCAFEARPSRPAPLGALTTRGRAGSYGPCYSCLSRFGKPIVRRSGPAVKDLLTGARAPRSWPRALRLPAGIRRGVFHRGAWGIMTRLEVLSRKGEKGETKSTRREEA